MVLCISYEMVTFSALLALEKRDSFCYSGLLELIFVCFLCYKASGSDRYRRSVCVAFLVWLVLSSRSAVLFHLVGGYS